jgi:hypothetical protein
MLQGIIGRQFREILEVNIHLAVSLMYVVLYLILLAALGPGILLGL